MTDTVKQLEFEAMERRPLGEHAAIRHDYDVVVTAAARLMSFATGKMPETEGPIADRQDVLAADDLFTLAVHARRLIAATITPKRASQSTIWLMADGEMKEKAATRVINVLIHQVSLRVIRLESHLKILAGLYTWDDLLTKNQTYIRPLCDVRSDENHFIFRVGDFIETFQRKILVPIMDACVEQSLFLDETMF